MTTQELYSFREIGRQWKARWKKGESSYTTLYRGFWLRQFDRAADNDGPSYLRHRSASVSDDLSTVATRKLLNTLCMEGSPGWPLPPGASIEEYAALQAEDYPDNWRRNILDNIYVPQWVAIRWTKKYNLPKMTFFAGAEAVESAAPLSIGRPVKMKEAYLAEFDRMAKDRELGDTLTDTARRLCLWLAAKYPNHAADDFPSFGTVRNNIRDKWQKVIAATLPPKRP